MFRNDTCTINENAQRRHRRTKTQFLKHVKNEEEKSLAIRAQEFMDTKENPMTREEKQFEQICGELKKLKREKFLKDQHKVLLHQNESEIREIVAQIKRANIQSQLVEQKASKENKLKEEKQLLFEEKMRFIEECQRNKELALEEEKESVRKKALFRQELLKQMQEKKKQRELEREIVAKERENRKKMVDRIQQDIEKEQQIVLELKNKLREDRDDYLDKLEIYKRQKKIDDQEDHRKQIELIKQREEAKGLLMEKRKKEMQERAAISERIGQQVLTLQIEKQKHNDLLLELLIGERLAKDDKRYEMNLQTQMQRARSLQQDFQRTFLVRQQESVAEREFEKNLAEEQMKIFQELERKDNEIENLKIPKNRQYRQDLFNAIKYKNWKREFEASQNKIEHEKLLEVQNKRLQEIEAEKLRLLKQEPLENLKFLPFKAISNEHRSLLKLTCKETNKNN